MITVEIRWKVDWKFEKKIKNEMLWKIIFQNNKMKSWKVSRRESNLTDWEKPSLSVIPHFSLIRKRQCIIKDVSPGK